MKNEKISRILASIDEQVFHHQEAGKPLHTILPWVRSILMDARDKAATEEGRDAVSIALSGVDEAYMLLAMSDAALNKMPVA